MKTRSSAGLIPIPRDQTLYLQIFENMLTFRGTGASILGFQSLFENHFSPVFFLILPVYGALKLFFSVPDTILFLSFLFLFAGSLFLFVFAEKISEKNIWIMISLIVMWIGSSSLNYLSSGGFRETFLSFIPLGIMIYSFEKNQKGRFVIASILLLLIREDYGLLLFGFLFLSFGKKEIFWKLFPLVGVLVFTVLLAFVIPSVSSRGEFTGSGRFSHLGKDFYDILFSPFFHPQDFFQSLLRPQNFQFLLDLLYPFVFLPLLYPRFLLPLLPYMLILFLDNYALVPASSVVTWYAAPAAPFLLFASAKALANIRERISRRVVILRISVFLMIIFPAVFLYRKSTLFSSVYFPDSGSTLVESVEKTKEIIAEGSEVYVSYNLSPFLGDRKLLYPYEYSDFLRDDSYTLIAKDFSSPAVWQDCCSREEYRKKVLGIVKRYSNRISYIDQNLLLISPAEGSSENVPAEKITEREWVEAEYTGSELFYNLSLLKTDGGVSRSLSGVLPGKKRSANAFVGGLHSGKGDWIFSVRIKGKVSESCNYRRRPVLVIRNMNQIYLENTFPVFHEPQFTVMKFRFQMTDNSVFFPVIRYRRCGRAWIDRYRLDKISDKPVPGFR
ncbi:MAG: DUF2079 domain-containing protein [Spirochaetia bacterium]|nr:DUF2079 domain-containing protein [Spirochaetia bacterium]